MIRTRADVVIALLYTVVVFTLARMSEDWEQRADVRAWFAAWRSRIAGIALRFHVWRCKP